jgi:hypothetical protein
MSYAQGLGYKKGTRSQLICYANGATPARLSQSDMAPLFESLTRSAQALRYRAQIKRPANAGILFVRDEGLEPPTFPV